jgi:protein tyrosine phosphatase type IVA
MKTFGVTDLVRACECGYTSSRLEAAGIRAHDMAFPDGDPPPQAVITKWLALCGEVFAKGNPEKRTVTVHCVAGLGRAPMLVALALVEDGMDPVDAVTFIRGRRRGAINAKQLSYLQNDYKRRKKGGAGCAVM